jgi:hypothetical protein
MCSIAESFRSISVWQHAIWGSARCVERRAICKEALTGLRLGEGRGWKTLARCVATPFWDKCEGEAHTPKSGKLESSGTPENSEFDYRGQTPRIGVLLVSLERSWSVDVQNGLAGAIWTSTTQVMGKRRAESQTGSLIPDH